MCVVSCKQKKDHWKKKQNLWNAFLDGNYNKRAKKPVATNVFIVHLQNTIPFLKLIN